MPIKPGWAVPAKITLDGQIPVTDFRAKRRSYRVPASSTVTPPKRSARNSSVHEERMSSRSPIRFESGMDRSSTPSRSDIVPSLVTVGEDAAGFAFQVTDCHQTEFRVVGEMPGDAGHGRRHTEEQHAPGRHSRARGFIEGSGHPNRTATANRVPGSITFRGTIKPGLRSPAGPAR